MISVGFYYSFFLSFRFLVLTIVDVNNCKVLDFFVIDLFFLGFFEKGMTKQFETY